MKPRQQKILQIVWGIFLLVAGIGMFFRIPQIMPGIEQVNAFSADMAFKRFCLYLIACLLVGGGVKKIRDNYKSAARNRDPASK